ncbi:MAG: response regulator receiver modulated metal dependent phosphohydrolase [Nitrospirae bacterium]|nr:response regulator receiver modulated metal dependent phosphohydrolase [Nitrospirota bacterium]
MAGERILVVDDEKMIRDLCAHILADEGYVVTVMPNGEAALAELSRTPTDLLITDIRMPGMDGLELFERVKKMNPDMVTIFITGHGTLDTAIESLMRGVEGFVLKPFTQEELVNAVDRAVTRSRLQKENIRLKALIPLFEISKLLVTEIDLAHLFRIISEVLVKEFSVERVSLMLVDEATGSLLIRASHGLPTDLAVKARRGPGEGVSGIVMKHRRPVIITKGKSDDPEVMATLNRDNEPLSSMSVPLIGKDKVLGVLNISKFTDPTFTTSDLQIVSVLASQVVATMENASLYEGLRESYFRTVQALVAAVEAKDSYTRWHSTNVAKYAVAIARDLGFSPSQLEEIHIAAILHDVGKIGISERIISKPDRLSREEFDIMKDHPAHGMRILEPIGFSQPIISAIYQHHERYDGKGYPQGIAGENIALAARILNVADTIDAMVSERPYRGTISSETVLRELERESGLQFDPAVSGAARKLIEKGLLKLGMHTYAQHIPAADRK